MSVLSAAVCLAAVTAAGPAVDFGAGIRSQTSGGLIPTSSETPSRLAADFTLTPTVALGLRTPVRTAGVTYSPRMLLRVPNTLDRPVFLHEGTLAYEQRLGELHTWSVDAYGRAGELDYARGVLLLDEEGTLLDGLPPLRIINYFDVGGATGLLLQASPRHQVAIRVGAGYSGPLDEATEAIYAYQRRGYLEGGDVVALTPLDDLQLGAAAEIIDYSTGARYVSTTPRVGWARRLNRLDTLSINAGAALIYGREPVDLLSEVDLGRSSEQTRLTNRFIVIPVGAVHYQKSLYHRRAAQAVGVVGAGVQPYFDPFQATLDPRAFGRLGATVTFATDTAVSIEGQITASVQALRLGGGEPAEAVPSFMLARAAVAQRVTRYLQLEVGARWSNRGTSLAEVPGSFSQTELIGYLAVVGGFGTQALEGN